jgi:hypothetical protein
VDTVHLDGGKTGGVQLLSKKSLVVMPKVLGMHIPDGRWYRYNEYSVWIENTADIRKESRKCLVWYVFQDFNRNGHVESIQYLARSGAAIATERIEDAGEGNGLRRDVNPKVPQLLLVTQKATQPAIATTDVDNLFSLYFSNLFRH